jgi:hypothetical protein
MNINTNTEWKNGYKEGFAEGWRAAQESQKYSYQNFPPVYYGGGATPRSTVGPVGLPTGGLSYAQNIPDIPSQHFATGMTSTLSEDC